MALHLWSSNHTRNKSNHARKHAKNKSEITSKTSQKPRQKQAKNHVEYDEHYQHINKVETTPETIQNPMGAGLRGSRVFLNHTKSVLTPETIQKSRQKQAKNHVKNMLNMINISNALTR